MPIIRRRVAAGTKPAKKAITSLELSEIRTSIIADAKKVFKSDDYLMTLSENRHLSTVRGWVKTDIPQMDWQLSDGKGLPIGKAIHLWGNEASGKSAFAQFMIPRYQAIGGIILYVDFEHSMDEKFIEGYGANIKDILYAQPDTIEQGWDILWMTLKRTMNLKVPVLIIWDSVAMGTPKAEFEEKSAEKSHVAEIARAMSKGCRRIRRKIAKYNATVLFINQLNDKIGVMFGEKSGPPGGRRIRYASDIMMKFDRIKTLRCGDRATGYIIQVTNKKNRLTEPHRKCEFILSFKTGIDVNLSIVHAFKTLGIIRPSGKLRTIKGIEEKFKEKDFLRVFKDNKKHCMELLTTKLGSTGSNRGEEGETVGEEEGPTE